MRRLFRFLYERYILWKWTRFFRTASRARCIEVVKRAGYIREEWGDKIIYKSPTTSARLILDRREGEPD